MNSTPFPSKLPCFWVALGNEGERFEKTRHNLGRQLLEALRVALDWPPFHLDATRQVYLSRAPFDSKLQLIIPRSYMNLSGQPLARFLPADWRQKGLSILHDDLEVASGSLKWKYGGSHHGHNGLRSVMDHLKSRDFWRIRLGVGRPPEGVLVEDYVLSEPQAEEREQLKSALERWTKSLANQILSATIAENYPSHR